MKKIIFFSFMCVLILLTCSGISYSWYTNDQTNVLEYLIQKDEKIHRLIRLSSRDKIVDIICLIHNNHSTDNIRDILGDWKNTIIGREKLLFPVIPLSDNGQIDLDNIRYWINLASLLARISPDDNNPLFPNHISPEMAVNVEKTFSDFYMYHLFDDPELGYYEALKEIISNTSLEQFGCPPYLRTQAISVVSKTLDLTWQAGLGISEQISSLAANEAWNRAFNIAKESGLSYLDSVRIADFSTGYLDKIWALFKRYNQLSDLFSLAISQGSAVVERIIAATLPIISIDGISKHLDNLRPYLSGSGEERLLLNAIEKLLPEINGEVSPFINALHNSLINKEFLRDLGVPALVFLAKYISKKSIFALFPLLNKAILALEIGFHLGNLLSNNPQVSQEIELAKYTKDIQATLYKIAFNKIYLEIKNQINNNVVSTATLEAFDSSIQLTLLSDINFWYKLANALNSTGYVKNIIDKYFRGVSGPEVAKLLLPNAEVATSDYMNWINPAVVQEISDWTLNRIKSINANDGAALALILDSTGSMKDNDPQNVRIQGGELILDQAAQNWHIAIIDFDTSSKILAIGAPNEIALREALRKIDSEGSTNIQAGLENGIKYLNSSLKIKKGAILLTDGQHNSPSEVFDYSKFVMPYVRNGWPVFTIGLTGEANEVLLSKIATMTGGVYFKVNNYHEIMGVVDLILSEFKLEPLVLQRRDKIAQGEAKEFLFTIDNSVKEINATQIYPGSRLDFSLVTPNEEEIGLSNISDDVKVIEGPLYKIIKVKNPDAGMWKAKVIGTEVNGEEPFIIKVSVDSPIRIESGDLKPYYLPSEPIRLRINLTGDIDKSNIYYTSHIIYPNGKEGKLLPGKNGVFEFKDTETPGVYYINIKAEGKRTNGELFLREQIRHIVVALPNIEFGIGEITRARGSYLEINLGREIGIRVGQKITIHSTSTGTIKKIAEGYIITVGYGKSIIEIGSIFGGKMPQKGDVVRIETKN